MELTIKGITLKKTQYRDNTAIVTLFTPTKGLLSVTAYGIHSMKNGVSSAIQTFTFGEFVLSEKAGKYTLKSAEVKESFGRLYSAYEDLCAVSRAAQVAMHIFCETSDKMNEAFELLYYTFSFMAYSDSNKDDLYLYFLLHALRISGQCPAVTHCAVCGKLLFEEKSLSFSAKNGGALCSNCKSDSVYISKLALEAMRRMLLIGFDEMNKVVLTPQLRHELIRRLEAYYVFWYA